jgi:predicted O-methyltransferase YrrM
MVELAASDSGVQGLEVCPSEADIELERTRLANEKVGVALVALVYSLAKLKEEPLTIVEIGTIRDPRFAGHEDGLSTYFIAKWIRESGKPHKFYSLELTHGHLRGSLEFLKSHGLESYVTYVLGDAEKVLEHFLEPIDFAYVDSADDPIQNLLQFRRLQKWMRQPALIVLDDVYDPRNANKGLLTVPIAKMEGLKECKMLNRMSVIAFGEDARQLLDRSLLLQCPQ